MSTANSNGAWHSVVNLPETRRLIKPRTSGITMVIDKGLGLRETKDLLEMAADHIDYLKIAFGSSALYSPEIMKSKISLAKDYNVQVYPGGTLFEIAVFQKCITDFFKRAKELGFTYIEVSEGTIDLSQKDRKHYIQAALSEGFGVLSEIGKKDRSIKIEPHKAIEQIFIDLETGAEKVIIEGRDSGQGVGIYNDQGKINELLLEELVKGVGEVSKLIIEAPQTSQHNYLLVHLGPNVNLGNVQPHDVLTLESTRVGLRGDTLKHCLKNAPKSY
ncbi:MAG: phosphosulfolactate synthase [Bacillota bacterium]|nr:phosphosulfolactate synthase [Bacillota bacterium]HHU61347.1 phosphosulfolactate synthase [Natronincola sp.]